MHSHDPWIERLAGLFATHPAWQDAARKLDPAVTSTVYFRHRPDEAWHLERRGDDTLLLPGAAEDPDFVFRFSLAAIDRLAAVPGHLAGDFAAELFALIMSEDRDVHIGFRVEAGFSRLLRRGYVRLLLAAAPRMRELGASYGALGMSSLEQLVSTMRGIDRRPWEKTAIPPARRAPRLKLVRRRASVAAEPDPEVQDGEQPQQTSSPT